MPVLKKGRQLMNYAVSNSSIGGSTGVPLTTRGLAS